MFFNGLGVIRALGRNNIDIVGMDCIKYPVGRYSRYLSEFIKVSNPNVNDALFVQNLLEYSNKLKEKAVLFPTNDVWAIAVSKYKEVLKEHFFTYNPSYEVIKTIIDKKQFYRLLSEKEILVPFTYESKSFDDLYKIQDKIKYPVIMKPNARMEVNRKENETAIYNNYRMTEIKNFKEFREYKEIIDKYEFLIQQKIEGLSNNMYTIGVYADKESNVRAVFSGRKVRGYPVDIGDCYAGESLWIQELVEISKKIIKLIKYTGIAEIEFKYNEIDKKYYLIEVNPRTWSWIGITPECGVNLPMIAYQDMIGEQIPEYIEMNKKKKVFWVRSLDDKINCIKKNYKQTDSKDFVNNLSEWKETLKKYDSIVYADKDSTDKKPGLFWFSRKLLKSFFR